jgi:L-asparagine oxygenase
MIIDNAVAVHGRLPFEARYDGTDRWLEKLLVRRDIRRFDISLPGSQRVRV